ncbi:hypothetical protein CC86DRAFT_400264 [Ophiobolus disseminans]|uniref:Uncharacterized protein n=1 Tax=Ophiobolus disseminans TaxID=1469910 RepID=A0A6A7ALX0_9PLEO|nr:hypothetical protein CC86DRAFT_400264 [Ophiobolus disseminans]
MAPTISNQPWKAVWPPAENVVDQANVIPQGLSSEEVINQRAYGSHASNTKGRIVHLQIRNINMDEYLVTVMSSE